MATRRRSQLSSYRTYGSVAYAPAYDGTAVRAPRREEVLRPKPRVRPRERGLTRTQAQVREAGQASVFAVIGFLAVGVFAALLGAAAVGWHREGVWQQQGQLLLCRQHRFHLHQLCVFHPDTGFTALQSPWAVTVQRANLTLVFPGKEKVTVRSVPLAALDFLEI